MRLPSGRILKTAFGSKSALTGLLAEFESQAIDGYIKTSYVRDGYISIGNIVFRKGKPLLAAHSADRDVKGEGWNMTFSNRKH